MSGTKGKSGGLRNGAGRPPKLPGERKPKTVYRLIRFTEPRGADQIEAMEWWESLTPFDRMMHVKETHYMCGNPLPHKKSNSTKSQSPLKPGDEE